MSSLGVRAFSFFRLPLNLTVCSVALLLLPPTHQLGKEIAAEVDRGDAIEATRAHETFRLYSILKAHGMDLGAASVWSTAAAIREESKRQLLDPLLVVALINVESRFQHRAVSTVGARGLMQIHPLTAPALAEETKITNWQGVGSLDDPVLNVKLGTYYLSQLKKKFRSVKLALSAYNLGPAEVEKRLAGGEVIPFDYADKVLAAHRLYLREETRAPLSPSMARGGKGAGTEPGGIGRTGPAFSIVARQAGERQACRQEVAYERREIRTMDEVGPDRIAAHFEAESRGLFDRYGNHGSGGVDLSCDRANSLEARPDFLAMTRGLG